MHYKQKYNANQYVLCLLQCEELFVFFCFLHSDPRLHVPIIPWQLAHHQMQHDAPLCHRPCLQFRVLRIVEVTNELPKIKNNMTIIFHLGLRNWNTLTKPNNYYAELLLRYHSLTAQTSRCPFCDAAWRAVCPANTPLTFGVPSGSLEMSSSTFCGSPFAAA